MEKVEEKNIVQELEHRIFQRVNFTQDIAEETLSRIMDEVILEWGSNQYLSLKEKQRLKTRLYQSMRGLDVLTPLLEREEVTEIMVNGPNHIFIEEGGRVFPYEDHFADESL